MASVASGTLACGADNGGGTDKKVYTLRFASSVGQKVAWQQEMTWYMNEVSKRSNGRIEFKPFYSGSLLGSADTLAGLGDGRTETAALGAAYAPAQLALWNMTFVPLDGTNSEVIARAQKYMWENVDVFKKQFTDNKVRPLIFMMISEVGTLVTPKPVRSLAEMRGMRIRAVGYAAEALKAVGAEPVAIPPEDTFESIQRGVLDGASVYTMDTVTGDGLKELAPWILQLNIGNWGGVAMTISDKSWNGLPADLQKLMSDVANEFYDQASAQLSAIEKAACDELLAAGGGVTALPPSESQQWRSLIGDSMWAKWRGDATKASSADIAAQVEREYKDATARLMKDSKYVSGLQACIDRK